MSSPHRLPRITGTALACGHAIMDTLKDVPPAAILAACNIEEFGAQQFAAASVEQIRPELADQFPDILEEDGIRLAMAGVLAGLCVGILAADHAAGHPGVTGDAPERAVRMTDADVDGALDAITRAIARHQGAGADNPDGLADSLRALDDVRSVFREVTGIGAPR